MGLTPSQVKQIREELVTCKNPLFFFHDDPDGLCSFLLLYKYIREGYGVVVKSVPRVDEKFLRKVQEYQPDKVFILDIAIVDQYFIDQVKVPIIWIDHHEPLDRNKVKYFNPRIKNPKDNFPATYLCHQITEKDLWIAMAGCIGDWFVPDFYNEFVKAYPKLIDKKTKNPPEILFGTELGKLSRIMSFILKGKTGEVMKCVKIMTRIGDPYEILEQKTPRGKFIYHRYEKMNEKYERLLKTAIKEASKDKLLVFTYSEKEMSFTGDLANELLYRYPNKIIVAGREKGDEIRMSLRASRALLPPILQKALLHVSGYGGGHEHACGACVKKDDFKEFLEILRKETG
ncbi:DHH family phosphoesterase [Candidatus Woesearchaeota archaeon]|nr:DHH family phosphoesterase [Candidatus Woesearchaeota archaeon]